MITCRNINSTFSKDKKHFTIGIEPRIIQTRWQRGEIQTARKNKLELALFLQEFTKGKITLIQHNRILGL